MTAESNANNETLACLIIDDPLLTPQYGCLDYYKLLQAMKEHYFFTEIAFIPWNYRRSTDEIVGLFAENPDCFGICVHGCNHIIDEFCGVNYEELSNLSRAALWRMEQHKSLTGLPYDPVMVFPGGLFSSVAMQALRDQGFVAAFNTTLRATDSEEWPGLNLQLPATRIYADFPLFLRRPPRDKAYFVQDIAAGRPILIVEHHSAFRNGYEKLTDLVDWVNSLGSIRWASLLTIAEYYLEAANGRIFFGPSCPPDPFPASFKTKVAVWRLLSEIRDNYMEKNTIVARIYSMLRNWYHERFAPFYR